MNKHSCDSQRSCVYTHIVQKQAPVLRKLFVKIHIVMIVFTTHMRVHLR